MDELLNMFNLSPVSSTLFFCYFFPTSLSLKIWSTLSLFKQPKTFKVVLCTERLAFLQNYWRAMQSQDPLWTLPWAAEQVKHKLLGMLTNRHTSSLEGIGRHLLFRSPLRDMLTLTGQAVENHTSLLRWWWYIICHLEALLPELYSAQGPYIIQKWVSQLSGKAHIKALSWLYSRLKKNTSF